MFAGVSSSSRATCPNTEMRRRHRRRDSEVRPVRCSTSLFRTRSYHRIPSSRLHFWWKASSKRLHWLPVTAHIRFKIALLTFNTLATELHSRPTPAALLVTTTQVRQSQPARNSADENRFRSTQLHLQCSTHLEQSTSRHHWQLGRHCNHFQKETQNVLLH